MYVHIDEARNDKLSLAVDFPTVERFGIGIPDLLNGSLKYSFGDSNLKNPPFLPLFGGYSNSQKIIWSNCK